MQRMGGESVGGKEKGFEKEQAVWGRDFGTQQSETRILSRIV